MLLAPPTNSGDDATNKSLHDQGRSVTNNVTNQDGKRERELAYQGFEHWLELDDESSMDMEIAELTCGDMYQNTAVRHGNEMYSEDFKRYTKQRESARNTGLAPQISAEVSQLDSYDGSDWLNTAGFDSVFGTLMNCACETCTQNKIRSDPDTKQLDLRSELDTKQLEFEAIGEKIEDLEAIAKSKDDVVKARQCIVDDMYQLNDKVTSIEDLKYVTQDTVDSLCGRMEIEGEVVLYGQMILDSGCQDPLGSRKLNEVLTGSKRSNKVVRTAVGNAVFKGDRRGILNMYTLNLNPNDTGGTGSMVQQEIDTVEGMNDDLFSMSDYYAKLNCDILLRHRGFSGIVGKHPDTGAKIKIPVRYDFQKRAWVVDYVVCKNPAIAERVGIALQAGLQSQSFCNMVTTEQQMMSDAAVIEFILSAGGLDCHVCENDQDVQNHIDFGVADNQDDRSVTAARRITLAREAATIRRPPASPVFDEYELEDGSGMIFTDKDLNVVSPSGQNVLRAEKLHESTECVLKSAKNHMGAAARAMESGELHRRKCHTGYHKGCKICMQMKKKLRRVYHTKDPFKCVKTGHTWSLDTLCWPIKSKQGNKYTNVLRDYASGYFILVHVAKKSDTAAAIKAMIIAMRKLDRFKPTEAEPWELFAEIHLDVAGEWREDASEWSEMCTELGITCTYGDPTHKNSMAFAENAIKQIELGTRYIMAESNLPTEWFETAANQAALVRNMLPLSRDVVVSDGDGDAIRPMERLSKGRYSRAHCNKVMQYLTTCGTPCLVSLPKSTGSDIVNMARNRWGLFHHMEDDLPVFECPRLGTHFRSKNYVAFTMPEGYGGYEYLGLPMPKMPKIAHQRQGEEHSVPTAYVSIDGLGKLVSNYEGLPMLFRQTTTAVHRESEGTEDTVTQPKVVITDEYGTVYEPDESTGVLMRTKGKVSVNENADDASTVESPTERLKSLLKYYPDYFLGRDVYKEWGGLDDISGVCHGVVVSTGWVKLTSGGVREALHWHVTYDDQVSEDLTEEEMIKWAIDYVDGTTVTVDDPYGEQTETFADNLAIANVQKQLFVEDNQDRDDLPISKAAAKALADSERAGRAARRKNTEAKRMSNAQYSDTAVIPNDELEESANDVAYAGKNYADIGVTHFLVSKQGQTFFNICEEMLDRAQWKAYYSWISSYFKFGHRHKRNVRGNVGFNDPWSGQRATIFPEGVQFPRPMGPSWTRHLNNHRERSNSMNSEYVNANLCRVALQAAEHEVRCGMKVMRAHEDEMETLAFHMTVEKSDQELDYDKRMAPYIDQDTSKIIPPKTFKNILVRPDGPLWEKAIKTEWDALMEKQVMSLGWTKEALLKAGIRKPAVDCRFLYDVKYKPDSSFDKYKARFIQLGHPGNCFKGVHYNEVFTATPQMTSTRILQALRIGKGWHSMPADVKTAFLHADTEEAQQYPLRMPIEKREYLTDENGNKHELFAMLHKNLYGSPVAPKLWSDCFNKWIREKFNSDVYESRQLIADPCMHKIVNKKTGKVTFLLTHTDDIDLVCEEQADGTEILAALDEKFGITMCNPDYMLGVQRRLSRNEDTGETFLEMIQPDFIDSMYARWEEHLDRRKVNTPMPPGTFLCNRDKFGELIQISQHEIDTTLKKGFQKVVGELLWVTRNSFPDCAAGMQQLCSQMAQPSELAWKAAMHMVKYLHQNRDRGIRFSSKASPIPTAFYDSSDKGSHDDEKAQYGYCVMMYGGPIAWSSKKHRHVGKSSSHNEYMAMSHCAVEVKWIRDLLTEMGFGDLVVEPTPCMGDNDQATRWSVEQMVTTGNKCIRTEYHWVKECIEEGDVSPQRIETARNLSDCMTKALPNQVINNLVGGLSGYEDIPEPPGPTPR